jgi:tetratricopeptide (TPR) repeat protein
MECVDPETMLLYSEGGLPVLERSRVDIHLDACATCREWIIELARPSSPAPAADGSSPNGPLAIGATIGRYIVLEWLGEGGMGRVYGAYDTELERRVALKVLRPRDGQEDARPSLLLEAKAMAKVTHPHVISLYDVGTFGDDVYLTMEYVQGGSLDARLKRAPRPETDEIISHFIDIAAGLSAVHEAGLVHGDFKPANVLLNKRGRVLITDFGLARRSEDLGRAAAGTPRYMSPEQRAGKAIDAQSDQYSFCLALREAFEARPIPAPVRTVLARGLSDAPAARFPSMPALVRALSAGGRSRRTTVVAAAALMLVALGLLLFVRSRSRAPAPCSGAERKLAGVWDEARRSEVAAAFAATGVVFGPDVQREVTGQLDSYARSWVDAHVKVCEATRTYGEQSEALMDGRIACLDDKRRELAAVTDRVAHADARVVQNAVTLVHALSPLAGCERVGRDDPRWARPSDESSVQERGAIRDGLARATLLSQSGEWKNAADAFSSLLVRARKLTDRSLEADVLAQLGYAQVQLALDSGEPTLYGGIEAAEASGNAHAKLRAVMYLVMDLGDRKARYDEAEGMGRLAAAILERFPEDQEGRAKLEANLGAVAQARGRYAQAVEHNERALQIRQAAFGAESHEIAISFHSYAIALFRVGRSKEAADYEARALAIYRRSYGARHPHIASMLQNLSAFEASMGDFDAAARDVGSAIAIYEATVGESAHLARAEETLASIWMDSGDAAAAEPHLVRAEKLTPRFFPAHHPAHIMLFNRRGMLARRRGQTQAALVAHEEAMKLCHENGEPSAETSETLTLLAETNLELRRWKAAVAPAERALALRVAQPALAINLAQSRFALARALWATSQKDRARSLAVEARDGYLSLAHRTPQAAEVEAWLAAHGPAK